MRWWRGLLLMIAVLSIGVWVELTWPAVPTMGIVAGISFGIGTFVDDRKKKS